MKYNKIKIPLIIRMVTMSDELHSYLSPPYGTLIHCKCSEVCGRHPLSQRLHAYALGNLLFGDTSMSMRPQQGPRLLLSSPRPQAAHGER